MSFNNTSLGVRFIARQTNEPGRKVNGMLWINPQGGESGNNTERYTWNDTSNVWELDSSVGPDTPRYATVGAFWRDTGEGEQRVYDGNWGALAPDPPISQKDVAETFGESDVSLTHDNTAVSGEAVGLVDNYPGATTTRDADNGDTSNDAKYGLQINPNTSIDGVRVTISANTGTVSGVYLRRESDNLILDEVTGTFGPGDTIDLMAPLSADTNYYVLVDDGGATYTIGAMSSPSFPYTGSDLDITAGVFGGTNTTTGNVYNIVDVTSLYIPTTGEVTVEWSEPNNVYRWDSVTYQHTSDGETVSVDIQESADGGDTWSTIATDVSRGHEIFAGAENQCRFVVSLSREDLANEPTLDAIYRRWEV